MPRAPLPASGVTVGGEMSSISSAGVTRPSSLLRAHAPVPAPPNACGRCLGHRVFAGCSQPLLVLGPSRRYLRRPDEGAWTPTPPRPPGAYPFLPERHRPCPTVERLGTRKTPCNATSTGRLISRLQSFAYVQAPSLARPPGCTHRDGSMSAGRPGLIRHAGLMPLPT